MIELNLLPRAIKKQIIKKTRYVAMVNNALILTAIFLIASALMLASQKYIAHELKMISENNGQMTQPGGIGEINNLMSEASAVQKDFVKWSGILNNFLALLPAGNTIQSINLDRAQGTMTMNGWAKTRDDFLQLKANLENSPMLSEIESPISNLLHRADVDFTMRAKLNL